MTCLDCRYWDELKNINDIGLNRGECRRYAPRPRMLDLDGDYIGSAWPTTYKTDWCGEFAPKYKESKK